MKAFIFLALLGCASATIIDTLAELGQTAILDLVEQAGLTEALSGDGPFTAFVPKQEVLENLPQEILDQITSDPDVLAKGLKYHVADGLFLSADGVNEGLMPTLEGTPLRLNIYEVAGETVATVAGVPIDLSNVDIEASNGVIHLLDFIILDVPDGDSVEVLSSLSGADGLTFDGILYAVEAAGSLADLQAATDITVVAPIDSDAFNVDIVDELLADPEVLEEILSDLIVSGTYYSAGIGASRELTTVGGDIIIIAYDEEMGYIITDTDGNLLADILAGNIPTTQGVLHIVDRPLIV